MTFKEYQKRVDDWIREYGVRYFDEKTNMLLLVEEVGELSRLMARKYGEQSFKSEINSEQIDQKIKDEMADVIFVLTCLSNQQGIDLQNALQKNLIKKTKRDHLRHSKNQKLFDE